jgi:aryl-alcohol dehydrogenase-like predicted oxidoreductase
MRYRQLGSTDLKVSEFSLGAMVFGWKTPPDAASRIIAEAVAAGINLIDTSNSYGRGRSEEVVGAALAHGGLRHSVILATKFRHWTVDEGADRDENIRNHIVEQCEESLRRLRTDYIDLYQLHIPNSKVPIEVTLRALDGLVRSGKVRHIGSSNFSAAWIRAAASAAGAHGLTQFVSEQAPYNLLDRSIEREILPAATAAGIGIIGWSPLAEGILSGKYRRGEPLPANSRYAKVDKPGLYTERLSDDVFDLVEALGSLAAARGVSLTAYCLAWLRSRTGLTSILIGPSTLEQLRDNLQSQSISLTNDEIRRIDELIQPASALTPYVQVTSEP